jgi:hypothetical protein
MVRYSAYRKKQAGDRYVWGVRSIWEAYTGWLYLNSTTELYDVPPSAVHSEIVHMAGGADAVAERAMLRLEAGSMM